MSAKFDIVVYGATGYTGQLVAEYLAASYAGEGAPTWAMAGRSRDKLASVRDAIGAPADTPLIVADAADPASLRAMVDQAKLVVTTVGPYQLYGSDLLAACVADGTDYMDLCGEPIWLKQMIDRHDAVAKASGARIMFSCGFDSIPFELGAFFVQEEARRVFGAPVPRVKGRVRDLSWKFSGGTSASARVTFEAVAQDLSLVSILKDPFAFTPGFEGPKQPRGNKPVFEEDLQSWSAPFAMATLNTRNVHRSNMLMGFPYGRDFVYDEMVLTGRGTKGRPTQSSSWPPIAKRPAPKRSSPARGRRRKSAITVITTCSMSRSRPTAVRFARR
ncbi:short subunit dehydrogenase-like uncharacterized protein [Bradyrhizobium barranii subsp. barranii]|nr:short subunit dehydrogenase-like uncharacterized protein [Bradyrhizobium japonicum]MCP1956656.1 short subunit dehydrogenase-like uncharacterized protein [Bradyrhizobium japonicum]